MSEKTTSTRKRVLAAVACVALLAAGCGSDDEGKQIPQSSAAELQRSLESIERRFDLGGGACQDITQGEDTDVDAVQAKIDGLPDDVDKDVRDALQESFDRLFDLVQEECTQTDTEAETETTPTEEVPTVTEEVPTVTETVPTETTPPPQTNTTPGNQGNGNGTGGGNGGGNSNGTGGGGQQAPGRGN